MNAVVTYFKNFLNPSIPMGRIEYLLSLIFFQFLAGVVHGFMVDDVSKDISPLLVLAVSLPITLIFSSKRLLDLKLNRLLLIALIIPFVNVILSIALAIVPGKK